MENKGQVDWWKDKPHRTQAGKYTAQECLRICMTLGASLKVSSE